MRRLFLLLLVLISSLAFATQEVVAPRVRVLFDDAALESYALRVAHEAEGALDALVPLFGFSPPPIVLRLENTSDIYNALASPLPRPNVGVRALFPTEVALSYRAGSDLRLVLVHELTHIMQFAYLEGRGDGLKLGLVGEDVANVPPAWLVEGLATWTESEYTTGGRRDDALTRGVLETAVLAGTWPTLADVSLSTYGAWPGAQTEYLFGVGFTDFLVRKHGFEGVKASLAQHNAAGFLRPFAASWRLAVGTDLRDEWRAWQHEMRASAEARAKRIREAERAGTKKTDTGWYTRAPALSPDGSKLAWVGWPAAIMLADADGGELKNVRTLLSDRLPGGLEWLDAHTLLYARPVPRPRHTYSEVFTLDTRTGRETQLTAGARAKLPAPLPGGCVLYVTDDAVSSRLEQFCPGKPVKTRWQGEVGVHVVGLATSRAGRVALSVWRWGSVDLALLEGNTLRYLTHDRAQNLEPSWRGETELVFRADPERRGVFELYTMNRDTSERSRLTRTVGGAFTPEAGEQGTWFAALGGRGYNLAWLPDRPPLAAPQLTTRAAIPAAADTPPAFTVRPYTPLPSLRPYGWVPSGGGVSLFPFGVALEGSVVAQDDSTDHNARLTLGFDSGRTALAGLYGYARYDYGTRLPLLRATPRPLQFSLQAGAWPVTPHLSEARETALGAKAAVTARLPQDRTLLTLGLEAGLVHLARYPGLRFDARTEAALSTRRVDPWGYPTEGWRGAVTGVWSAAATGPSLGAWLDGAYVRPLEGVGRLEFGVRAGYRPAWPLPLTAQSELAGLLSVGLARSFPTQLRYGDGLYALERVTLAPRFRTWLDSALHIGGDLTTSFDLVLGYGAPVSVSGTLGYTRGFWYRLGLGLPL